MDAARFRRLCTVYERAAQLPDGERTPFLDEACKNDAELRSEAERMLASRSAPLFLSRPDEVPGDPDPLPERIGRYRILSLLGEGGFGVVYRAEQREPVERAVALKVLHRRRASERVALRFEAEAQTLARLQHENVAQLYDAGCTTDGQLYFAMELVEGWPITAYCDRVQAGIATRLGLFLRTCEAIQHAHQRGVVHRDLKPSNVLVKGDGTSAVPKVIDFGIAKALYEQDGEGVTGEGLPIGTPAYMSPEQAAGSRVDTRTDVYSLGVMLYALLAGDLPFAGLRLTSASPAAALRIVREEAPRRMSIALQECEGTSEVAARRACNVNALTRVLRGDLEWIVRKALAKDPQDRYASVSALIADVRSFLRSEPVSAREHAVFYVLRCFVARHRLGVAVGLVFLTLAAAGVGALAWGLREVSKARDLAIEHSEDADRQRHRAVLGEYAAHLAAARSSLAIGAVEEARRHLSSASSEHRGWEWRHLATRCEQSLAHFQAGAPVFDVAWLDDERVLLRQAVLGEVRNVRTGALEHRFGPFEPELDQLLLDVEHRRVIVDVRDRIELWETERWTRVRTLYEAEGSTRTEVWPANRGDVRAMAVSADGTTLFLSDNGGVLRAVNIQGDGLPRELCKLDTFCWAIATLDPHRLALATNAGRIEFVDARTGERRSEPLELGREGVKALVSSHDGARLYAASGDTIQLFRTADLALQARRSVGFEVTCLALSRDDTLLYSSGDSESFNAWDAATLQVVSRFHGHGGDVHSLASAPGGDRVASGGGDGAVHLWPTRSVPAAVTLEAGMDARDFDVARDGTAFAVADAQGWVREWDAESLGLRFQVRVRGPWRGCALGRDEVFVAGDELVAIDRETHAVRVGAKPLQRTGRLTLDPGERWLLGVASLGGSVHVWELPSLEVAHSLELPVHDRAVFDDERDEFLVAGTQGGVYRVDPVSGRVVVEHEASAHVRCIALHGRRLAHVSDELVVFEPALPPVRYAGSNTVSAAAFSTDGTRLATSGADRLLRLWDARGTELLVLDDAPKPMDEVAFADGGRQLIGLSRLPGAQSYLVVWSAPPIAPLVR